MTTTSTTREVMAIIATKTMAVTMTVVGLADGFWMVLATIKQTMTMMRIMLVSTFITTVAMVMAMVMVM